MAGGVRGFPARALPMADAVAADAPAARTAAPALAGFRLPPGLACGDGRPHVPDAFVAPRDPLAEFVLQRRDLALLGSLAWLRELRGDQAHWAHFATKESVFSRRLGKLQEQPLKLLKVDRFAQTSFNRLKLTGRGCASLVEHCVMDERDIFVPRAFLPMKDVTHGHLVAALGLVLDRGVPVTWHAIFPSWTIQRRVAPTPAALPDVVAVRASARRPPGRICAFEIDLGTERLRGADGFVSKLVLLANELTTWVNGGEARIVILTRGPKRLLALRAAVAEARLPVPTVADLLPSETGRPGIEALSRLLSRGEKSTLQADGGQPLALV